MRLITDEQHALIVEALYQVQANTGSVRLDALVEALAALQALPEVEVVAWIDEWGNAFPLASRKFSIVGENWKPLYATKEPK